jgi:hypothetical protein
MNDSILNVREFSVKHAVEIVKAIAVSEKMGILNTEEDLTTMIAAGIETAIEDYYQKLENLKNEVRSI